MSSLEEIKKAIKEKKAVIGTKEVEKALKLAKIKKVYLTSNCPEKVKENIKYYAKIAEIEVEEIKKANDELGVLCKKPYSISVLGV